MRIITIVSLWNLIKLLAILSVYGMAQACVEGETCYLGFWGTMYIIYPVFPYLIGFVILLGEAIKKQNTKAINLALQKSLYVYLGASITHILILGSVEQKFFVRFSLGFAHCTLVTGTILFIWLKNKKPSSLQKKR